MEVIEGTVESVNDRGVRLNGEWYNVSKFKAVQLPRQGERVQLGVDTKGFILDVIHLDETPAVLSNELETRLQVLQAAAIFVGQLSRSRQDVRSEHVLQLADKWLEWVNRGASSG
jgi:hypothetical protein